MEIGTRLENRTLSRRMRKPWAFPRIDEACLDSGRGSTNLGTSSFELEVKPFHLLGLLQPLQMHIQENHHGHGNHVRQLISDSFSHRVLGAKEIHSELLRWVMTISSVRQCRSSGPVRQFRYRWSRAMRELSKQALCWAPV